MSDSKAFHQKNIFLASHVTDLAGPTEALVNYLIEHSLNFSCVTHPLDYCVNRSSKYFRYEDGDLIKSFITPNIRLPKLLTFFSDFILNFIFFFLSPKKYDIFIGVDPLNCFAGIVLKKIRLVDEVIFYTIDWMPTRFQNGVLNTFYHFIDRQCVKYCDYSWNLSPGIVEVRSKQGIVGERNIYVPVGVDLSKVPSRNPHERDGLSKSSLDIVLLGALAPSKGVQIVLDAWPSILKEVPNARLHVIGKTPMDCMEDGVGYSPFEPMFLALGDSVKLVGVLGHDEVLKYLVNMDIGLALYKPYEKNLSNWADPSRIKDYMGCGAIPVVTKVPMIARDIEALNLGCVTEYNVDSLVRAILLLSVDVNSRKEKSKNCIDFMQKNDWRIIFFNAFKVSNADQSL